MRRYYCTLFDKNYLTRGLALHDSLLCHCQRFQLWILCMDEVTYDILAKLNLDNVSLIKLSDFEDKKLLAVKSTRTSGEYCWTCTPSLPLYVFKHFPQVDMISYLDADLYFYSSPEPIFEELGKNSIMVIPHRFSVNRVEKEKKAGIYNVSMLTFRRDKSGLDCLSWWRERCLEWCYNRQEGNKLGDQKYLEQFPKLFEGVHLLKHIGANVAPWNIHQYQVSRRDGAVYVNDVPLIFYHFLGLKIHRPLPFLPPVRPGGYGERSVYRALIYEQYFQKLYEEAGKVRQYIPGFSCGFAPRPKLWQYLKDELSRFYPRF